MERGGRACHADPLVEKEKRFGVQEGRRLVEIYWGPWQKDLQGSKVVARWGITFCRGVSGGFLGACALTLTGSDVIMV